MLGKKQIVKGPHMSIQHVKAPAPTEQGAAAASQADTAAPAASSQGDATDRVTAQTAAPTPAEQAAQLLRNSEALIITASNGMSIQEGFNIFANDRTFQSLLGDLARRYGFNNHLEALSARHVSPAVRWTIYGRVIDHHVRGYHGSAAMADLLAMARTLPHFVLTSNGEGHFQRAGFEPSRVLELEGSFAQAQCPHGCGGRVFDAAELVEAFDGAHYQGILPAALVPTCPDCETPLTLRTVEAPSYVQNEKAHQAFDRFLEEFGSKRICVLELGVGPRHPMLKGLAHQVMDQNPQASYVCVNLGQAFVPMGLADRSVVIDATCGDALAGIRAAMGLPQPEFAGNAEEAGERPRGNRNGNGSSASPCKTTAATAREVAERSGSAAAGSTQAASTAGCPDPSPEDADPLDQAAQLLLDLIDQADAVLVGAASGLSAAAGYRHYYERDAEFVEWFGDFEQKYGFHSSFEGFYHPYASIEERWAFIARMMSCILSEPTGQPYRDLRELLTGKDFHLLTTNQDTQMNHLFPEHLISAIQGDDRFLQCSRPCHDQVYDYSERIHQLNQQIGEDLRLESSLIPRCPECGAFMEPWVRGPQFLEGQRYMAEYAKVKRFLQRFDGKKILFLELGVGRMTPMFIQEPFWQLTYSMPQSTYCTINPKDARVHPKISQRSHVIPEDIAAVFARAAQIKHAQ